MPEIIVKYDKPETLRVLKSLAKFLDFKISNNKKKETKLNGVTVIPGDPSIDISEMEKIFSGKNLEAKELRQKAWQRGQ